MPLRSLNEPFGDVARFHARLVDLAGVKVGDSVLDLGCGMGRSLPALLARASEVVALDVNPSFLKTASATNEAAVADGKLSIVEANAVEGLPFEDGRFDKVICQDMLECLPPKRQPDLIQEVFRVLRPGGVLLLGHHDYDGIVLHSKDESLTRRLVATYSTQTQEWMASADGAIGRKLPGLGARSSFSALELRLEPLTSLGLRGNAEVMRLCRNLMAAGQEEGVEADALSAWLASLYELEDEGAFFLSVPWVYLRAVKGPAKAA